MPPKRAGGVRSESAGPAGSEGGSSQPTIPQALEIPPVRQESSSTMTDPAQRTPDESQRGDEPLLFDLSTVKIEMPQRFGGEKSYNAGGLNIHSWLAEWRIFFNLKRVPDSYKPQLVPSRLKSMALTWYESLAVKDDPRLRTWSEFRSLLIQRWEDRNLIQRKWAEFKKMQHQRGTSLAAYNEKFLHTYTIIGEAGFVSEIAAVTAYIQSLLPRTRAQLSQQMPTDLNEAMAAAETQDTILRDLSTQMKPYSSSQRTGHSYKAKTSKIIKEESSEERLRTMGKDEVREEDRKLKRCFRCHKAGHRQSECRTKFKPRERRRSSSGED